MRIVIFQLLCVSFLILGVLVEVANAQPSRVATLIPNVNNGLEADPDRYQIVATVRRSMHSPAASAPFDLGSPHSPSIEQLVASDPDLVIGDATMHARLSSRLESLGLDLVLVDTTTSNTLLDGLREIANRNPPSEILTARVQSAEDALADLSLPKPVQVVALFGVPGSFYLVSERWWLGAMMKSLGFQNLVPDIPNKRFPGLVPVNDERLAVLQPEIVFLISHGDPQAIVTEFQRMATEGGVWSSMSEATLGVHALSPELFMATPGLDAPTAARELIRLTAPRDP